MYVKDTFYFIDAEPDFFFFILFVKINNNIIVKKYIKPRDTHVIPKIY